MIKQKKKICAGCNTEQFIWSKKLCKSCSVKQHPPKSIKKISEQGKVKKAEKTENTKRLHKWFLELWDKQEDKNGYCYCYETGKPMHRSIYRENSCVYSHCYPKSRYPEFAFKEWNLLIVLPDIHTQWETDRTKTPKMLNYYNDLFYQTVEQLNEKIHQRRN